LFLFVDMLSHFVTSYKLPIDGGSAKGRHKLRISPLQIFRGGVKNYRR